MASLKSGHRFESFRVFSPGERSGVFLLFGVLLHAHEQVGAGLQRLRKWRYLRTAATTDWYVRMAGHCT